MRLSWLFTVQAGRTRSNAQSFPAHAPILRFSAHVCRGAVADARLSLAYIRSLFFFLRAPLTVVDSRTLNGNIKALHLTDSEVTWRWCAGGHG